MRARFLGGVAACLSAAGGLAAQQPAAVAPPNPQPAQAGATVSVYPQPAQAGSIAYVYPTRSTPRLRFLTGEAAPQAQPASTSRLQFVRADAPPAAGAPAPKSLPPNPGTGTALPPPAPHTTASQLLTTSPGYANCDPCQQSCQPCCEPCGPPGRFWIDAGYVFWTTKGQNVPPLITSAPAGTPRATAGVVGDPNTTVLYGGRQNDSWRSGFTVNMGFWFDQCQTCGIEGNFFYLGQDRSQYTAGTPGAASPDTIITRPFTNGVTGAGDTELVSFPGVLAGSVSVDSKTNVLGGGANFIKNLCCGPCGRFDLLLGYQNLTLKDDLTIREDLTSLPGQTTVTPGTRFQIEDRFRTTNSFNGVNLGFAAERRFGGRFFVGARAGVALGVTTQTFDISGSTTITPPNGAPQTFAGGLLTQPSNIGSYSQNKFAVMPTVGLKLGAQLTDHVRAYVGYDYMYLSNVARAGDQIDLRVNPGQIPSPTSPRSTNPALPAFTPRTTDFWMQGVKVGLEVRF